MRERAVVVDTSIVIKWVIDEPDSDIAQALLTEWTKEKIVVLAPPLLAYEVINTLYQNVRKGEFGLDRAKEAVAEVERVGIVFDFSKDTAFSTQAVEFAQHFGLSAAYDAHYLALAQRRGCELWTADTRLWRAVSGKLGWVRLMSDYHPN